MARKRGRRRRGPVGRPLKYSHIIKQLDPDTIYSSASIARFAESSGFITGDPKVKKSIMLCIRVSCNRLVRKREFPKEGDGQVLIKGQAPTPGWSGWRWQQAMDISRKIERSGPLPDKEDTFPQESKNKKWPHESSTSSQKDQHNRPWNQTF